VEAAAEEAFAAATEATQESSLRVTGTVRADERAPGGFELAANRVELLHLAQEYPISRKAHGVDFLMNHRHLWLRSSRQTAILRIRDTLIRSAREYFHENGFVLVDTPLLVAGAAEGAGTLFEVDYFGDPANLAQTGQLYLESACMALGKVYCFGPTFRAEKSKTRRHLTEFWMIEPEIAFADLDLLLDCAEGLVCRLVEDVLQRHPAELEAIGRDPAPLRQVRRPFHRLTYSEAVERLHSDELYARWQDRLRRDRDRLEQLMTELADTEHKRDQASKAWQKEKLERRVQELQETTRELEAELVHRPRRMEEARAFAWGRDLGGDEETLLSQEYDRPVFITEYPREVKAFYMKPAPANPNVVLNLDLLAPEGYGEIIGGSVREDELEALEQRLAEERMDPAPYRWYLDLRRYGSVPHGGFGLGLERTLAWICGLPHVREAIPFPRLLGRMYP
jgi:asparaginyl-tRNA synthetase